MNWFKHRNIATKLAAAFLLVIGMSVALGALEINRLAVIDHAIDALPEGVVASATLVAIDREVEQAELWITVLLGLAVVGGAVVAVSVTRALSAPIRELTTAFQAM